MAALAQNRPLESPVDPMFLVRSIRRMKRAGFTLTTQNNHLEVSPAGLKDEQRSFLKTNKPALVELLNDVEILHGALVTAGKAGLAWREGTPPDWTEARLLAAGELLYSDGRMVNRNGRRYAVEVRP